jgi:site-specific DNA-methyltransferase (adenine-specific)
MTKPYYKDKNVTLYHGDAQEIMPGLGRLRFDMIFTDPPYPREFLECYRHLAINGGRLLKRGGFLYCYCGLYLADYFQYFRKTSLQWFWIFTIIQRNAARLFTRSVYGSTKHVLVYTQGNPNKSRLKWCQAHEMEGIPLPDKLVAKLKYKLDRHKAEMYSKDFHEWSQGSDFPFYHIQIRTKEQEIVLDPFAGSGTTLLVCKLINRKSVGIEMDEKHCETIAKRCAVLERSGLNLTNFRHIDNLTRNGFRGLL